MQIRLLNALTGHSTLLRFLEDSHRCTLALVLYGHNIESLE